MNRGYTLLKKKKRLHFAPPRKHILEHWIHSSAGIFCLIRSFINFKKSETSLPEVGWKLGSYRPGRKIAYSWIFSQFNKITDTLAYPHNQVIVIIYTYVIFIVVDIVHCSDRIAKQWCICKIKQWKIIFKEWTGYLLPKSGSALKFEFRTVAFTITAVIAQFAC